MNLGKVPGGASAITDREDIDVFIMLGAILPSVRYFTDKRLALTTYGVPEGSIELLPHPTAPELAWLFPHDFRHRKTCPTFERRTGIEDPRIQVRDEESAREQVQSFFDVRIHTPIIPWAIWARKKRSVSDKTACPTWSLGGVPIRKPGESSRDIRVFPD